MKNIFTQIAGYGPVAILVLFLPSTLSATVTFSTAPLDQTVCAGSPATFTVGASGAASLTYQWQVSTDGGGTWNPVSDGATYTGSTTMTLRISAATSGLNNYKYRCTVSDGAVANSTAATLHVNAGTGPVPSLSGNISQTQCANTFGSSPVNTQTSFNYQWQTSTDGISWTDLDPADADYSGTQDAVLSWYGTQTAGIAILYRYTMTSSTGCSALSAIDTLRLAPNPNSLIPSPTSTSVCPGGGNITFTFAAPPSGYAFRWQESADNGVNYTDLSNNGIYSGVSSPALGLTGIVITAPMKYRARISLTTFNVTCETFSIPGTLTLKTLPAITAQPTNAFVCAGTSPKLTVTATGSATLTYQWQVSTDGGSSWANAGTGTSNPTTRTMTLNSVTTSMDGYKYQVIVNGPCNIPLTSSAATLHIGSDGTWLGAQDTAWEHVGNWCSIVPIQTTDVLVPSWAPRMPLISDGTGTAYSRSLTIQSGASLTISGGSTSMTGPFSIPGTVSYTGVVDQNILPADHGSLYISGSGNKLLQSNVAITSNLGLAGAAKLVTGNKILTMNAGSNPIIVGSATSWIVTGNGSSGAANTGTGGLRMAQVPASASNLLFPLGPTPAAYNPLSLTNSGAVNDFTIAVNDQDIPGGPAGGVVGRTWLVSAASSGSNVSIGLQWNQPEEETGFNRNDASIIRSDGTTIVQKSAAGAANGTNPYAMAGSGFSTLTQFSVGTNTMVPLPLQLISFSAQWINDAAAGLSWTVDPQSPVAAYTVQRSTDGLRYTDIGTVTAATGRTSYSYIDTRPSTNNSYRLLLKTPGGNTAYSRIVQLSENTTADRAALAPSVTERSYTSLLLSLNQSSDVLYTLSDISGHIMTHYAVRLAGGDHNLPLDISRLPAGVYFVRVTGSDGLNKTLTLIRR